ncbi:MAG: hypothetical protein K0U68_11330 [Gammaproteobacteria bacterium]|nr:hypothetical protein [Gammaproteobacteria bacterium]
MNNKFVFFISIVLSVTLLVGCGIRLKGSGTNKSVNTRLFVTGLPLYNPFIRQLKSSLETSGGTVTNTLGDIDAHLHILDQKRTRRELSLSQRGKANEFELTYEVTFEVIDKNNQKLMEPQSISVTRDYFNQQLRVLGKANEEDTIWQEIYKATVNSFLQRLSIALKRPIPTPAPVNKPDKNK